MILDAWITTAYAISSPFMPSAGTGPQVKLTVLRSIDKERSVGNADGTADSKIAREFKSDVEQDHF